MSDSQNDLSPTDSRNSPKPTLLISGASGLIGTALIGRATAEGYSVRRLVRHSPRLENEYQWDPSLSTIDRRAMDGVDVVVNLSGASLSHLPWTAGYKQKIYRSRIDSTNALVEAMHRCDTPPKSFLSASGVGYYGNRPGEKLTASTARGTGFLSDVCADWEAAAHTAPKGVRVVTLRTSVVLSRAGGVLPILERIAKLGAAGPLGAGTQYWPWISLRDHVDAQLHLMHSSIVGPVNLASPEQTSASTLVRAVAHAAHRPYWLPTPRFALVAALGDAAKELLLSDQFVEPDRLVGDGYEFHDPKLVPLVTDLYAENPGTDR